MCVSMKCIINTSCPHLAVGGNTSLCKPQPQAWVGVVHLDHFKKGVKGCIRVAGIQLLQTKVIEEHVATVHAQHCQWPA